MMTIRSIIRFIMLLLLIATFSYSQAQITSTFDSTDEGWVVTDDASTRTPEYIATGGNPGGYVSAEDNVGGGFWYWSAPNKFLGNHSSVFGKMLQFDLRQSGLNDQRDRADVILAGAGDTLVCALANNPDITWTHYDVPLDTRLAWKIKTLNGALAIETDIQNVLADITTLKIRGEYISGDDRGDLDNVVLPDILMPLHLLSFTAAMQNAGVILRWTTSNEINTSHFDIEHSTDGLHFTNIGIINAASNSTSVNTYTFTHTKPVKGVNFYRLKMTDKDGAYTYSQIAKVIVNEKTTIEVFPNPVVDNFTVNSLPGDCISKIQLIDITGKILEEQATNSTSMFINISHYPAGIYFVRVLSNNQSQQVKIKKQ